MQTRFEGEYLSATARTLALIAVLAAFVVMAEVNIWATFTELAVWEESLATNVLVAHEGSASAYRKALTDGFLLFFFSASAVLFLRWLSRTARNARALGAVGMRFGPRAAVGWWFVPVFHLWKPFQVLKELFQASHPKYLDNWRQAPVPRLLSLWWALWVAFQVTVSLSLMADFLASSPDQVYMAAWGSAIVGVFAAPLGVAAAIGSWRLRSLQRARARCTAPMRVRQPWPTRSQSDRALLKGSPS